MEDAVDFKKIGENIRILRTTKGMNQQELADVIGISNSSISQYENGKSITIINYIKICDFFEVTLDELAGRYKSPMSKIRNALESIKDS